MLSSVGVDIFRFGMYDNQWHMKDCMNRAQIEFL